MEIPGPPSQESDRGRREVYVAVVDREYPLVAKKGRGAIVEDVDGNAFLDFAAGIASAQQATAIPKW